MNTKHTPGPLFVRQPEDLYRNFPIEIVDAAGKVVHEERRFAMSSKMRSVADVLDGIGWPCDERNAIAEANQRQVADAYIRAAGPEMLEALKFALKRLLDDAERSNFDPPAPIDVVAMIESAIAKATPWKTTMDATPRHGSPNAPDADFLRATIGEA